jgi:hypothetical protein
VVVVFLIVTGIVLPVVVLSNLSVRLLPRANALLVQTSDLDMRDQ